MNRNYGATSPPAEPGYTLNNYPVVHGAARRVGDTIPDNGNGLFGEASSVTVDDITDGTSQTFAIGERRLTDSGNAGAIWMRSTDRHGTAGDGTSVAGVCHRTVRLNDLTHADAFSSNHEGGAHFLLADGTVRFISEEIDAATYEHLAHRSDGQDVSDF